MNARVVGSDAGSFSFDLYRVGLKTARIAAITAATTHAGNLAV
jgi:hypothetical protein